MGRKRILDTETLGEVFYSATKRKRDMNNPFSLDCRVIEHRRDTNGDDEYIVIRVGTVAPR